MARPKKGSGITPAREQIIETFWRLVDERPLSEITVSSVVQLAGCNRTTFYYHFPCFEDLVKAAVEQTLPIEVTRLALASCKDGLPDHWLSGRHWTDARRIGLLAAQTNVPWLVQLMRGEIEQAWARELGVDVRRDDVAPLVDFMVNGLLGLVAGCATSQGPEQLELALRLVHTVLAHPGISYLRSLSGEGEWPNTSPQDR